MKKVLLMIAGICLNLVGLKGPILVVVGDSATATITGTSRRNHD